jgi:ribosomal protein S12 methylthiotransferase accessory factor
LPPLGLTQVLAFRPCFRVVRDGDDRLFLLSEEQCFMLGGAAHARVAALLDGVRPLGRVLGELRGELHPAVAYDAVLSLVARGYVTAVEPGPAPPARLALTALRGDTSDVRLALELAGLEVGAGGALTVVVVEDYLDPALDAWNRDALAAGTSWTPLRPDGASPWIGPVFGRGRRGGPCWACLAHRLRANRPVETYLAARGTPATPPRLADAAVRRAALAMAALWLRQLLAAGVASPAGDRLHPLLDRASGEHVLHARPQCAVCGDAGLYTRRAAQPVALEPRPASFTDDGGHRVVSPEETFARHAHLVSPLTGVVSSLGPMPGADPALQPVFAAGVFNLPEEVTSADDFQAATMGKGRSTAQARAAALCEALERQSARFHGDEPRRAATLDELGDEAVSPDDIQLFSAAQREPFDRRAVVDWTPAWSLTHDRRRWLPTGLCYLGAPDRRRFEMSSNGHAAGNCLEEAILQGFLELVERDATAIWWYGRHRRPGVPLADPSLALRAAHLGGQGYEVWALDLTHDLEIPVYAAVGCARGRWRLGFGAHLDARLALDRALAELGQLAAVPAEPLPALADAPFLRPDGTGDLRRAAAPLDLRDSVLLCVERAARAGLETIVLDQSRPDLGVSAVKVVVPGLRHIWPRFAPGRLYEVPVRLGWRAAALSEAELNPVPLRL